MRLSFIVPIFACVAIASAQQPPKDTTALVQLAFHASDFFSYRISFTTAVKRYFPNSDLPSEYTRQMTCFVTQRIGTIGKDGIVSVDANIDSMRIHVERNGEEVNFDSQDFKKMEHVDLSHPELGPTMVLNKPFTYRMTLEGDFIDMHGFEVWLGPIDSATTLDSLVRIRLKEYMSPEFLRQLVTPAQGFVYGRRYHTHEEFSIAAPLSAFTIPVVDSARFRIEFPTTHKRFFLFGEGKASARAREIRDHGFKETSLIDSVRGTVRDTIVLAALGHVEQLNRTSDVRAFLRTERFAYSQDIHEQCAVRLEDYERR